MNGPPNSYTSLKARWLRCLSAWCLACRSWTSALQTSSNTLSFLLGIALYPGLNNGTGVCPNIASFPPSIKLQSSKSLEESKTFPMNPCRKAEKLWPWTSPLVEATWTYSPPKDSLEQSITHADSSLGAARLLHQCAVALCS